MTARGWRRLCVLLGALCAYQAWHGCAREPDHPAAAAVADCSRTTRTGERRGTTADDKRARSDDRPAERVAAEDDGINVYGFKVPAWAAWFAPHPGEDLVAYRDRIVPIARAAIAPQRTRVAQIRDDYAALAHLDAHQLAELDGAAKDAATELENRVVGAVMTGELSPALKPMAGVELARELLDDVDRQNTRFLSSLTAEQRTQLANNPFDFGDYLLFSTHWEDAFGVAP